MNHQTKAHSPKGNPTSANSGVSFKVIGYYPNFKIRLEGKFPKNWGCKTEESKKGREQNKVLSNQVKAFRMEEEFAETSD